MERFGRPPTAGATGALRRRPEPFASLIVIVALAAVACGQMRRPFHTLSHELAAAFTVAVGLTVFFAASARSARTRRPLAALRGTLAAAGLAGALALALLALLNELGPACDLASGIAFFATTYVPAAALAAVAGTLCGLARLRPWQLVLLACGVIAVDLAHDVAQAVWGPGRIPIDFLIGELQFGQRAGPEVATLHLRQRGLLLLAACVLWNAGLWHHARALEPDRARRAAQNALVAGGLLVALVALAGSHFGVGWGWGRTLARLDATLETEHFVFHVEDEPWVWSNYDALAREAEWDLGYIERTLGFTVSEPVHVFIYAGRESLMELTGVPSQHAQIRQIHVIPQAWRDDTLLHELVHAVHVELDPSWWIVLSRGMLEGTAEAIESGAFRVREAHEVQAGALAAGGLPPARSLMSLLGFAENHELAAYRAAGSFLGWLILEHGTERFLELQRTLDFEEVYGQDLDALDAGWRAFLAGIPLEDAARLEGGRLFDPATHPPYLALDCPKLGPARAGPVERARRQWATKDYDAGHRSYLALWEEERRAEWALWAARSLAASARRPAGAHDAPPAKPELVRRAIDFLRDAASGESLPEHDRASLIDEEIRLLTWLRDWPDLERAFERRAAAGLVLDTRARMAEACLREPALREEVARGLLGDSPSARLIYEELLARRPGFLPLLYLRATALAGALQAAPLERRVAVVREVAQSCADCADLVGAELVALLDEALAQEEWDAAAAICATLLERSTNDLDRYRADLALDRLARKK